MKTFVKLLIVSALCAFAVVALAGCDKKQNEAALEVIKIGASPTPHAEILAQAVATLKDKGYQLEIIEFDDYVMPNNALDNGDIDANYFQHTPYLVDFNNKNQLKNKLVSAGIIHFEPLGIYPGKTKDLKEVKKGWVIGIPSDPTNGARALWLLDNLGLIKVKESAGFEATEMDIESNPNEIVIKPLEAAQLPASLPDLDFAVINGNYALGAGIMNSVLATEGKDSQSAMTFGNVIAVREADLNKESIKSLIDALKTEQVRKYMEDSYKGVVIPVN
ncbi:MAG: MetQ/NlpA family ABC transporter substrate-binding protein [Deferribacterales bacterium]|nr:MetQ/NlpA family ABC transporter substrate-binding protein [Deferribacterales bacterium]